MSPVQRTAAFAILVLFAVRIPLDRVSATNERLFEPLGTYEIASAVPSGTVLRLVALGHNEAMADLVWLNAISFYGRYFSLDTDPTWLDPHIEAIIELDPRFRLVFEWAGAVIMYGGTIDNDSVMAANRFLELGVERFPFDWSLRFMLGVNYFYELQPTNLEELGMVDEWRAYGAQQIAHAAGLPNAPSNLHLAAASLLRRSEGWEQQVRSFRELYPSIESPQARSMRRHIEDTMSPVDAEILIRARHLVHSLRGHPSWGFMPPNLALTVHPDPVFLYRPDQLRPPPFELTR